MTSELPRGVFVHEHTVRFHETDRAGIIYFARVFEYCHIAFEEMLRAIFGGVDTLFRHGTWGMPLVDAKTRYLKPIYLDERLRIELRVARLGRGSVRFAYRVLGPDGTLRAETELTHAIVSMAEFEPQPVPPELRAGLQGLGLVPADAGGE